MRFNPNLIHIDNTFKVDRKRIAILQGGSRSGKTYSALQWIVRTCVEHTGLTYSIVRKTLPALKASSMRDFFDILKEAELYNESNHNKTENTYLLNDNLIEFFSVDDASKIRGRKRDILFANEANELELEDWRQLLLRTTGKVIIDYNPSDFEHWIYEQVIPREDAKLLITTYKDNPHLPESLKKEIEQLESADPEYWKIFGLGQRGQLKGLVFNNFTEGYQVPQDATFIGYGLDWGFSNDPTAVVSFYKYNQELYIREELYERGLTNQDVADKLRNIGVERRDEIFADSAEPKSIEEVYRLGYNIKPTAKGKDSIINSIDILRRYKLNLIGSNLLREFRTYKWKIDKAGHTLNEPIDFNNHLIDATRYLALMKLQEKNSGKYTIMRA
jgi:phage terminase large subunit